MKAAIFPISTLGDGLIFTILAQCLANYDFETTLFSNSLSELGEVLKDFDTKACNEANIIKQHLNACDLIVCDPHNSEVNNIISDNDFFLTKTVWVTCTRCPEMYSQNKVNIGNFNFISGALFNKNNSTFNMVQHAVNFCKTNWKLSKLESIPNITFSKTYNFQRNKNRVCIFPYSGEEGKNYYISGFKKIAYKLKSENFNPVFIGTNKELTRFKNKKNNCKINFISFESTLELLFYIFESGFVIANDSGGGHLASLVNIPAVTIHKKKNSFKWRPGWRQSYIVTPKIILNFLGQRVWRPFISRKEVINHIKNYKNN